MSLTSSDFALAIEAKAVTPQDSPIPFAVQFPMVFKTKIDSSHVAVGDRVEGTLKENLTIEGKVVAPAGSSIIGHIQTLILARRLATSALSKERRFKKGSSLKICFDEIIAAGNRHIAIVGRLSKQKFTVKRSLRPREVEVGAQGEFKKAEEVFTTEQQAAAAAVNFITGTGIGQMGAVASFGALPVVMGVVGAVNPDLVTMRPMKADEKHPKVKGFAYGVLTAVPGAPVIQAFAFKGQEIHIEPGDEFLVQAHAADPEEIANLSVSATRLPKSDGGDSKASLSVSATRLPKSEAPDAKAAAGPVAPPSVNPATTPASPPASAPTANPASPAAVVPAPPPTIIPAPPPAAVAPSSPPNTSAASAPVTPGARIATTPEGNIVSAPDKD